MSDNEEVFPEIGPKGVEATLNAQSDKVVKIWNTLVKNIGPSGAICIIFAVILTVVHPESEWSITLPRIGETFVRRDMSEVVFAFLVLLKLLSTTLWAFLGRAVAFSIKFITTLLGKIFSSHKEKYTLRLPDDTVFLTRPKSVFVRFTKNQYGYLAEMTQRLAQCPDYQSAALLLLGFQQRVGGHLYTSFFPQPFAVEKAKENSPIVKGEGLDKWCWWRWEDGEQGFQLLVSLCQ